MGKHVATSRMGGWLLGTIAGLIVIGSVAGGSWYLTAGPGDAASVEASPCPSSVRVVTASSFAPVLAAAGRTLRAEPDCVTVEVTVSDGRAAAAEVERIGAHVWIPDDAAWVATARRGLVAARGVSGSGTVLATSPIYMVTDPATADRIWASGGTWSGLTSMLAAGSGVKLVIRDPGSSGDGMVAAGALGESVWLSSGMDAASLALAAVARVSRTVTRDLAPTPEAPGEIGLVPEYALLPTLAAAATRRAYLTGADRSALLRFTWLPSAVAAADGRRAAAMARLLAAFDSPDAAAAIGAAHLRGRANTRPAAPGAQALPAANALPFDVLDPHHVHHVFATWDPADRRGSLLIVVDVSAAGGRTGTATAAAALDVLRQGCRLVSELLPDGSRLGLWEAGVPHRRLVPSGRLDAAHRASIGRAVGAVTARRGGPGLYESIGDAYVAARNEFQAGTVNQVLVFTDDPAAGGADARATQALVDRLRTAADPQRPVRLSIVVLGQPGDGDRLKAALEPVSAYVTVARSVDDVRAMFIHVVAGGAHSG